MNAGVLAAQVKLYTKELKMPGFASTFEEVARDAQKAGRSHLESLAACLAAEVASRTEHRLAARIKGARFPALKSFDTFDFSLVPSLDKGRVLDLGSGAFTAARENVVCLGASGTGKTHIAGAIGLAAIYSGARVRFVTAITLAQELLAAADEHRLPRYLKSWRSADLVIVDELGYLPLGPGAPLLFSVLRRALRGGLGVGHHKPRVLALERGLSRRHADRGAARPSHSPQPGAPLRRRVLSLSRERRAPHQATQDDKLEVVNF
jgi:DNA replication protein DnaC